MSELKFSNGKTATDLLSMAGAGLATRVLAAVVSAGVLVAAFVFAFWRAKNHIAPARRMAASAATPMNQGFNCPVGATLAGLGETFSRWPIANFAGKAEFPASLV